MQIRYKYIHFELLETKKIMKTDTWSCRNNNGGYELGFVKWYPQWRQYAFYPAEGTVFNQSCIEDILNFFNKLERRRRAQQNGASR